MDSSDHVASEPPCPGDEPVVDSAAVLARSAPETDEGGATGAVIQGLADVEQPSASGASAGAEPAAEAADGHPADESEPGSAHGAVGSASGCDSECAADGGPSAAAPAPEADEREDDGKGTPGDDEGKGTPGDDEGAVEEDTDVTESEDEAAGRSEAEAERLKAEGNRAFAAGDAAAALALYEQALQAAPLRRALRFRRAAYHANRAACLLRLKRFEDCVAACDDCLDLDPTYLKAMLRRASALEGLDMLDEAAQDYEDILAEFSGNSAAKDGLDRVKQAQAAKEEALKTEMLGKLRGIGDSLLGHFGLSVDNFKFEQDPKTGGYNINFQQGAAAPPGAPSPGPA